MFSSEQKESGDIYNLKLRDKPKVEEFIDKLSGNIVPGYYSLAFSYFQKPQTDQSLVYIDLQDYSLFTDATTAIKEKVLRNLQNQVNADESGSFTNETPFCLRLIKLEK